MIAMIPDLSPLRFVFAVPVLATLGPAQTMIFDFEGPPPFSNFGRAVSAAGDVNGDGFDDFLVGDPFDSTFGAAAGSATLYSGRTGAMIRMHYGAASEHFGLKLCGPGDVNHDAFADYAVYVERDGGADPGAVRVYDGFSGSLLYSIQSPVDGTFTWGYDLAAGGDVNGDGVNDLLVPGDRLMHPARRGDVWVYSGADGTLLRRIAGHGLTQASDVQSFTVVRSAGDIDGDGLDDVIITMQGPTKNSTVVRVVSIATGSTLHEFWGRHNADSFQVGEGVGDWNDDGTDDFGYIAGTAVGRVSKIRIHSGATGSILQEIVPTQANSYVHTWTNVGDTDGDGRDDLAMASMYVVGHYFVTWVFEVFAGGSGAPMYEPDLRFGGGPSAIDPGLAAAGDVNGDGLMDVMASHFQVPGRVFVYSPIRLELGTSGCAGSGCPCGNDYPQGGCRNSTGVGAKLTAYGIHAHLHGEIDLHLTQAPPSSAVILLQYWAQTSGKPYLSDGLRCMTDPLRVVTTMTDTAGEAWIDYAYDWQYNEFASFQCWYRDLGGPCGTGTNYSGAAYVRAE
jgi:hypothetical protein